MHHLSGQLFQCLATLSVKNFFLMSNLNLPSLSLKPFPIVLSQQTPLKSLFPSFLQPLQILKTTLRSHGAFPSLSLSSQGGVPSLGSFLWPSSGRSPTAPRLSCTEHSPSGCSAPGEVSQHGAEGQIPSLTLLATLLWMQPRMWLALWAARAQC